MHSDLWECVLKFVNFSAVQERHRIARDLHDSLGNALIGLNFQLQTAIGLCKSDSHQAWKFLNEARRLAEVASGEVRQSVKTLRDDEFETQSLEKLVESLVQDFEQTTGIVPQVNIELSTAVPSQFTIHIYRIIQEALNNICKYAVATAVEINVSQIYEQLHLSIKDNGRGFDPERTCGGYGLQGMRERVDILQGSFRLESQPGHGCCINVEIPMQISRSNLVNSDRNQSDKQNDLLVMNIISVNNKKCFLQDDSANTNQDISLNSEGQLCQHHVKIGKWQTLNLNYLL